MALTKFPWVDLMNSINTFTMPLSTLDVELIGEEQHLASRSSDADPAVPVMAHFDEDSLNYLVAKNEEGTHVYWPQMGMRVRDRSEVTRRLFRITLSTLEGVQILEAPDGAEKLKALASHVAHAIIEQLQAEVEPKSKFYINLQPLLESFIEKGLISVKTMNGVRQPSDFGLHSNQQGSEWHRRSSQISRLLKRADALVSDYLKTHYEVPAFEKSLGARLKGNPHDLPSNATAKIQTKHFENTPVEYIKLDPSLAYATVGDRHDTPIQDEEGYLYLDQLPEGAQHIIIWKKDVSLDSNAVHRSIRIGRKTAYTGNPYARTGFSWNVENFGKNPHNQDPCGFAFSLYAWNRHLGQDHPIEDDYIVPTLKEHATLDS